MREIDEYFARFTLIEFRSKWKGKNRKDVNGDYATV